LIISQIPLAPFAKGGIRTVSHLGRGLGSGLESEIYTLNTEEPENLTNFSGFPFIWE